MFNDVLQDISTTMVLEWKEWDHEAAQYPKFINALRNCGLLKFFRTTGLRAQIDLLLYLISLWDVDWELFIIKDQELVLEEIDIYFITRLSRRGERVQLFGSRPTGESTSTLVKRYFLGSSMTGGGKVKIAIVTNLPPKTIMFTIARVSSMKALHEASQSQFRYAIKCLTLTVFN